MCPNHPEHAVDRKLLPPEFGITDRMLLWDKHAPKEISENAIKLGFLRKLHRTNPPHRLKRKMDVRKDRKVRVPASIKAHYRYPPKALPQSRAGSHAGVGFDGAVVDEEESGRRLAAMKAEQRKTVENKEKWLREMISKQTAENATRDGDACIQEDRGNEEDNHLSTKETDEKQLSKEADEKLISMEVEESAEDKRETSLPRDSTTPPTSSPQPASTQNQTSALASETEKASSQVSAESLPSSSTEEPAKLDPPPEVSEVPHSLGGADVFKDLPSLVSINDLISEQKSEMENKNQDSSTSKKTDVTKDPEICDDSISSAVKTEMPEAMQTEESTEQTPLSDDDAKTDASLVVVTTELDLTLRLNALDRHLVEYLALDRLRQLMVPREDCSDDKEIVSRCRKDTSDRLPPSYPTDRDPIALFTVCEFDSRFASPDEDDDVIPMFANTFSVGTNADCDVALSDYVDPRSPCFSRFSSRHLVVFRDKYAGVFELLNYGAEGVVVDNVYYGCDVGANRNRRDKKGAMTQDAVVLKDPDVKERVGRGRKRKETQAKKQFDELTALKNHNRKAGRKKENIATSKEEAEEEKKKMLDRKCECGRPLPGVGQTTSGWEGSAVLYHGSVIQIGCFTLVFSVFQS